MNDRIKQLLIQSEVFNKDGTVLKDVTGYELNKFAELIVAECIAQCEKNAEHEWLGSGSKLSAFNIKQHFGVEE